MKRPHRRQLHDEQRLAAQVTGEESEAVGRVMYRPDQEDAESMAEQYTPAAVVARQRQIIVLLNGVRSLAIALVVMFVVLGIVSVMILTSLNDARDTTVDHSVRVDFVLCDLYRQLDERPPPALEC